MSPYLHQLSHDLVNERLEQAAARRRFETMAIRAEKRAAAGARLIDALQAVRSYLAPQKRFAAASGNGRRR